MVSGTSLGVFGVSSGCLEGLCSVLASHLDIMFVMLLWLLMACCLQDEFELVVDGLVILSS